MSYQDSLEFGIVVDREQMDDPWPLLPPMAHPAVAQAAVIAVPDERWGERPLAVISLRAGAQASAADLRGHLAQDFAKWQLPDRFEFVTTIPCTATGKFKKNQLRDQFVPA